MSSDPAAGAPAAVAPAGARVVAVRNGRIPFEILALIAVVGAAAAGRLVEAALVAFVVGLGAWPRRRLRAWPAADEAGGTSGSSAAGLVSLATRVVSAFTEWFMPLTFALAAAVLLRSADIALALTLLLVASPQALLALPRSSPLWLRALAATMAAALLAATLAGMLGLVTAALLQQASMLAARIAPRSSSARVQRPT
ncbi:MAG: hypothetical protein LT102_02745 [Burkholderiaceae bacterium]|nr:hypothetical protein [Burkholderiaceae bacterium]